ncbi:hypothetical protein HK100_009776 [Physocladia obscura]|uniref:Uncharacterized protein n=1 Tax=Physocladia obscura TaxID=109957 RepID=A0AAD5SNE1_9FUNG|nr:hypothetical protein HK100_009776 [Physocladia obscura]
MLGTGNHPRRPFSAGFAASRERRVSLASTPVSKTGMQSKSSPLSRASFSPNTVTNNTKQQQQQHRPKKEFDTAVHNLSEMKLTPVELKLKARARDEYTKAHRVRPPILPNQSPQSNQEVPNIDHKSTAKTSPFQQSPPQVISPHRADVSLDNIVDLDAEIDAYFSHQPNKSGQNKDIKSSKTQELRQKFVSTSIHDSQKVSPKSKFLVKQPTAMKPTAMISPKNKNKTVPASTDEVPYAIQNQLLTLLESLETLSSTMGASSSDTFECAETIPPTSQFYILAHTLAASTRAVEAATRLVTNNLIRADTIATNLISVSDKVKRLDERLDRLEIVVSGQQMFAEGVHERVLCAERELRGDFDMIFNQLDTLKLEYNSVGFGNGVHYSAFESNDFSSE